jgi:hypothetical protein
LTLTARQRGEVMDHDRRIIAAGVIVGEFASVAADEQTSEFGNSDRGDADARAAGSAPIGASIDARPASHQWITSQSHRPPVLHSAALLPLVFTVSARW